MRSASVGAAPRPKKHFTSRAESAAAAALDVRCACQFFQSDSLLPERINPVGSRPSSSLGYNSRPNSRNQEIGHIFEPYNVGDQQEPNKFSFGIVNTTDYYAESLSRPNSPPGLSKTDDPNSTAVQDTTLTSSSQYDVDQQQELTGQKDMSRGRSSRQNSFENMHAKADSHQHLGSGFIKQRDPSTSSLVRRRMSSQQNVGQSQSFDETQNQQQNLLATKPRTSMDNVIKQRDPSQSSLLRRRLSNQQQMMSQESMEVERILSKQDTFIKQRDPSTSSLLRKRMSSQPKISQADSFEAQPPHKIGKEKENIDIGVARLKTDISHTPAYKPIQSLSLDEPPSTTQKPSLANNFVSLSKSFDQVEANLEQAEEKPITGRTFDNVLKQSGKAIMSVFRKRSIVQSELISPKFEKTSTVDDEQLSCDQQFTDDTAHLESSMSTVMKNRMNFTEIPFRSNEVDNEKSKANGKIMLPQGTDTKTMLNDNMNTISAKVDEPTTNIAEEILLHSTGKVEGAPEQPSPAEVPLQQPSKIEEKPKTVESGLIEALALSMGMITDSAKRSKDKQSIEDIAAFDLENRLLDHYTKDVPSTMPVTHQSRSPTRRGPDSMKRKIVSQPLQRLPELPTTTEPPPTLSKNVPTNTELIPRRNMISGFQDRGQIIGEQTSSPAQPSFIKQRDPSTSSLCRKRYTHDIESKTEIGSQSSLGVGQPTVIKQKDPATSTLLQKRRHMSRDRAESADAYVASLDKISKTVSFEFDKQLIACPYEMALNASEGDNQDIVMLASDHVTDLQRDSEETTMSTRR